MAVVAANVEPSVWGAVRRRLSCKGMFQMAEIDNRYAQQGYGARTDVAVDEGLRAYMQRVYSYMAAGVALTGIVAFALFTFSITTDYTDPANSVKGPYSWRVTYTPDAADLFHTGVRSACDAERFAVTYTNDPGPGTDLP